MKNRFSSDRRGAVGLLTLAAMTVICGFGALVIDFGMIYLEETRLQTACDAAALAGAGALSLGEEVALQTAREVAAANGVATAVAAIRERDGQRTVVVTAERTVGLGLARVLGVNEATVNSASEAGTGMLSGVRGAIPLGVVWQDFEFGQSYRLKVGPDDSEQGNFGALALAGRGADPYRHTLKYGFDEVLRIGQQVETEPGNMTGPTKDGVNHRINQCTPGCAHTNCARVVLVPVIDRLGQGRSEVQVVGFATFVLEGCAGGEVWGKFIENVVSGEVGPANDYGTKVVRLTR